jgi:hypothetical protein
MKYHANQPPNTLQAATVFDSQKDLSSITLKNAIHLQAGLNVPAVQFDDNVQLASFKA